MQSYPATISLSTRTLNHLADRIRGHRQQRKSRWRRLDPGPSGPVRPKLPRALPRGELGGPAQERPGSAARRPGHRRQSCGRRQPRQQGHPRRRPGAPTVKVSAVQGITNALPGATVVADACGTSTSATAAATCKAATMTDLVPGRHAAARHGELRPHPDGLGRTYQHSPARPATPSGTG